MSEISQAISDLLNRLRDAEEEVTNLKQALEAMAKALKAMLPESNQNEPHLRPNFEVCEVARTALASFRNREGNGNG